MQIRTTVRYHFMPVREDMIKMSRNNNGWRECREEGTLTHHCLECELVQPLWKFFWDASKINNKTKTVVSNFEIYQDPVALERDLGIWKEKGLQLLATHRTLYKMLWQVCPEVCHSNSEHGTGKMGMEGSLGDHLGKQEPHKPAVRTA